MTKYGGMREGSLDWGVGIKSLEISHLEKSNPEIVTGSLNLRNSGRCGLAKGRLASEILRNK